MLIKYINSVADPYPDPIFIILVDPALKLLIGSGCGYGNLFVIFRSVAVNIVICYPYKEMKLKIRNAYTNCGLWFINLFKIITSFVFQFQIRI